VPVGLAAGLPLRELLGDRMLMTTGEPAASNRGFQETEGNVMGLADGGFLIPANLNSAILAIAREDAEPEQTFDRLVAEARNLRPARPADGAQ
jgi:hypothetical protein